ncbi:hypothetical protein HAX54_016472 [Datura stramonium]|uniref:Uncharacterized protein n=1 Tax=Datura stramonium TaxID=4076 RepID=A0ABS8UL76_DATST|nr:hypothetical protein [Datura stramonium]
MGRKEQGQLVKRSMSMAPQPLSRYGLHWFTKQEDRLHTLGLGVVFDAPGDCNLNMEPVGVNGPVFSVNEHNALIDNILSHLYGMQMLQLRMNSVTEEQLQQLNMDYPLSEHSRALCKVGTGFEEPIDDEVATEDEMARVDSDIEQLNEEKIMKDLNLKKSSLDMLLHLLNADVKQMGLPCTCVSSASCRLAYAKHRCLYRLDCLAPTFDLLAAD